MMQIYTVWERKPDEFDYRVNKALKSGWKLTKREVLQPLSQPNNETGYIKTTFYAELIWEGDDNEN